MIHNFKFYNSIFLYLQLQLSLLSQCSKNAYQGRQTGGGLGGVSTPPEFWMGGGVEHLSTPPDFEKNFSRGVGSP